MTDDRSFAEYRKKLEQLGADLNESALRIVNKMADVGMNVTIKNTPVGEYPSTVSFRTKGGKEVSFHVRKKIGGTLKKNWLKKSARRVGNGTESRYFNNIYYGLYVNNGHRLVSRGITTGYVPGKRMLEQGINAVKEQSDAIFQEEIRRVKQKGGW